MTRRVILHIDRLALSGVERDEVAQIVRQLREELSGLPLAQFATDATDATHATRQLLQPQAVRCRASAPGAIGRAVAQAVSGCVGGRAPNPGGQRP